MKQGEHAAPWSEPQPGAQVARAAAYLMHAEVENGTQCPLTMTYAGIPVLRRYADALPSLATKWLPRLLAREHDAFWSVAGKTRTARDGCMTERQGGLDVRATHRAVREADGTCRRPAQMVLLGATCDAS